MENVSKALLIAAVVLIVIILIALGIRLLNSQSDTQKVAADTGKSITDKTGKASEIATSGIEKAQIQFSENTDEETAYKKIGEITTKNSYGNYINLGTNILPEKPADWEILYNDKSGCVYAILTDYLPINNVAIQASGLKTYTYISKNFIYSVGSEKSRQDFLDRLNNRNVWNKLISSKLINQGAYVTGAVSADIIMASYNEKYGTKLSYKSKPCLKAKPSNSIDTFYVPHPGVSYGGCQAYWLSTPDDANENYIYRVDLNGNISSAHYNNYLGGVRPVVCLPSDIKIASETSNGETIWKLVQ